MQEDSLWKLILIIVVLLSFVALGVGHVVKPDWFIKRSGARRGGEMLSDWNRMGFQFVGLVVAAGAAYALYSIVSDYLSH